MMLLPSRQNRKDLRNATVLFHYSILYRCLNVTGAVSTLSRSHSIAAAGDKSLVVSKTIDIDKSPDRIMQELQYAKK